METRKIKKVLEIVIAILLFPFKVLIGCIAGVIFGVADSFEDFVDDVTRR